ncbi:hypothetical protein MBANPS3_007029 [Mucor bainieri]
MYANMLLSTAALEKHKDNFEMLKHQMKLNRVKSYIADQQSYIHQYQSPNSSDIGSIPESCENQEPLSSNAFSASISEVIRRKQGRPAEAAAATATAAAPSFSAHFPPHPPSSSYYIRKQPLLHPPSIDHYNTQKRVKRSAVVPDESLVHHHEDSLFIRHNKKHKSSSSSLAHGSERIPLQQQAKKPNMIKKAAHGMHLLQKFVSPNLQISRITTKSNIKQPKLGIFRKGKSSAQGRPIPDLTDFQESIIKHKENYKPTVVMEDLSHEPPSISKFFIKRPVAQTTNNSAPSHTHHHHHHAATTMIKPRETPHTTPVLSSDHQARRGTNSPAAAVAAAGATTPYEAFSNNSFDSIYRLLDECQDMNQYLTPTNTHHARPCYSHVKTPHSIFQPAAVTATTAGYPKIHNSNLPFLSNNKLPHPLFPSPATHRPAAPHHEQPVFAHPPHYSNTHSLYYDPPPKQPMRKPSLLSPTFLPPDQRLATPAWQVTESVASFAANTAAEEHTPFQQDKADNDDRTTAANDDLELILQSRAMNMLGESIQQNDDNIQSFWLHQPSFTTRGH